MVRSKINKMGAVTNLNHQQMSYPSPVVIASCTMHKADLWQKLGTNVRSNFSYLFNKLSFAVVTICSV